MRVESTAILVRWLNEPATCPVPLDTLLVITAQVGSEGERTHDDREQHILPRLRQHGIRYLQVARRGRYERDGSRILEDARTPTRMYREGAYTLLEEMLTAGTIPQYAGGPHLCALKWKATPIDAVLEDLLPTERIRHTFGYNADETRRVRESQRAFAMRVATGRWQLPDGSARREGYSP
jgi:hypothetical protein